jgi:hypothetical protein
MRQVILDVLKKSGRRTVIIGVIVAIAANTGLLLVSSSTGNLPDKQQNAHVKLASSTSDKRTSSSASTADQTSTSAESSASTQANQKHTTSGAVTNASDDLDFSLSQSVVTVATGERSPVIWASTNSGKPVQWVVFGAGASGIMVGAGDAADYGITSNSPEARHGFTVLPSPTITKPGTYTVRVEAYIPRGPKLDKQLTVTVTQGPTFTLAALTPDYSKDTATQFFIPFQIKALYGTPSSAFTASASIVSSNGSPMIMQGVWPGEMGPYSREVAIMDYGQASGHVIVRVTVTDGLNTISLDIPYDVQTQ